MSDSIPVRAFENMGYNKNVVILTQPKEYIKQKNSALPLIRIKYKKFPKLIDVMENRHIMYNETTAYIKEKELNGELFVIRPEEKLNVNHIEHNPDELEKAYQTGRKTAEENLEKLKEYLKTQ